MQRASLAPAFSQSTSIDHWRFALSRWSLQADQVVLRISKNARPPWGGAQKRVCEGLAFEIPHPPETHEVCAYEAVRLVPSQGVAQGGDQAVAVREIRDGVRFREISNALLLLSAFGDIAQHDAVLPARGCLPDRPTAFERKSSPFARFPVSSRTWPLVVEGAPASRPGVRLFLTDDPHLSIGITKRVMVNSPFAPKKDARLLFSLSNILRL
jgi:hypothetical protein